MALDLTRHAWRAAEPQEVSHEAVEVVRGDPELLL